MSTRAFLEFGMNTPYQSYLNIVDIIFNMIQNHVKGRMIDKMITGLLDS